MTLGFATILDPSIRQDAQQADVMFGKEGDDTRSVAVVAVFLVV